MSPVSRTRWVTFDCYGTLVDWQTGFASAIGRVAGDRAPEVLREYHAAERNVQRGRPHQRYRQVLAEALSRAAARADVPLPAAGAHVLSESWHTIRPFDDSEALLAELRARGYRLAVLTNCDDELFEVTHRMFRQPFDLFVTSERVRAYKPQPWHFRAFQLITGACPHDWVHVGSSWYHDVAPAQALGIRSVWLDRERTGEDSRAASAHVLDTREAATAIEALFAAPVAEDARACA